MTLDLVIKNVKAVSSTHIKEVDVGVSYGKIVKIGKISGKAKREIDGSGKFLLPGVIDSHVHFRDPGFPEKGDFTSESMAAVAGGVTTVLDMPNTKPPIVTVESLEEKRKIASKKSLVNFGFYFGFTWDNFDEIKKARNIAGVKLFMAESNGSFVAQNTDAIEKLLQMELLTIVHAEDASIIKKNEERLKDSNDPRIHSLIRDHKSAYEATKHIIHLAKKHHAKIHITHLTTAKELEEIVKFRQERVTADVTPHHLAFTDSAYAKLGNFIKTNPPIRNDEDRKALWNGLRSGELQCVASDHAPHTKKEKSQDYWKAPSGVPGVQTLLPFLLDSVAHGSFTLQDIVRVTSENPAKIFGIQNKGRIAEGYDADLVLVDMALEQELTEDMLFSKCGWSPFTGFHFHGWPVMTVVNGEVVYENGRVVGTSKGKEINFTG